MEPLSTGSGRSRKQPGCRALGIALEVAVLVVLAAAISCLFPLGSLEDGLLGLARGEESGQAKVAASQVRALLTVVATAAGIILVLAWRLTNRLLRPLTDLVERVDAMARSGKLASLEETGGAREISALTSALNRLVRALSGGRQMESDLLRESEETLRYLMEEMPVGVALVEGDGKVSYLNRWFQGHFGYTLEDLPDLDTCYARAYPDPSYREALVSGVQAELARARAEGGAPGSNVVSLTCKDGSVRKVIINRQFAGQRRLTIFTDVTERESVQNELLKSQKLESLGVLAGGIAHDFNNILTGILGNVSLAQMLVEKSHPACEPLAHAERAAGRAAELAAQLLTFAKGGAPVKKVVALDVLVEETVSLGLRGSQVSGKIRIPAGLHAIEADEGQICQVFHNIVLNAVQSMPGGGTLVVSAENLSLEIGNRQGLAAGDYVRLTFADEGCGIKDEIIHKIFDPYFTTKPGGTGLGLASVHSIVKRHGGHVEVRSLVGRGTDFTFYLPSTGAAAARPELDGAAPVPIEPAGRAVLVMDDDQLVQTLAAKILQHLGYRVTTCSNGEDAVALYQGAARAGSAYFAAIMDLTVPGGMGGKEAAQLILSVDPQARLIVSSGYSNDPVMADFSSYGFCAAIAKPYRVAELEAVLAKVGEV